MPIQNRVESCILLYLIENHSLKFVVKFPFVLKIVQFVRRVTTFLVINLFNVCYAAD